jgi:adenine-specific DNA-methyltransferase
MARREKADVFDRLPEEADKTDFYRHDQNWSNRMILGDSLQVMASLAEREGLRGQVQCISFDPPYGIKFNSDFQWSTTSRDVKDGKSDHITREPEQLKAFRDTWRDGIHSYLTYLRDRLTVARDLLTESGSIFVQIGDENVHRVRAVMDEVFGDGNFCCQIAFRKTAAVSSPNAKVNVLGTVTDVILWFAKNIESITYRQLYLRKTLDTDSAGVYSRIQLPNGERRRMTSNELSAETETEGRIYRVDNATSTGFSENLSEDIRLGNYAYRCGLAKHWKTHPEGMRRLLKADRLVPAGKSLGYIRFIDDFAVFPYVNTWMDTGTGSFTDDKMYVVQTGTKTIERRLLMATDPGDVVLDPTCGSGTTAYVAEQWGRRWITIDTSRVALARARARIMGARYPYYLLADSREGQKKEADVTRSAPSTQPVHGNVRLGFVYERVPHITLKSIANNAEIDVIHEKWQATLEPLRASLNKALKHSQEKSRDERENPRKGGGGLAGGGPHGPHRLVGGADRAAEGNRRLDRGQGGRHGVGERDQPKRFKETGDVPFLRSVRAGDPRESQDGRRPAGPQGRQTGVLFSGPRAGSLHLRRGPLCR